MSRRVPRFADLEEAWQYYRREYPELTEFRGRRWNREFNKRLLNWGWYDEDTSHDDRINARILFYHRIGKTNVSDSRLQHEQEPELWES